METQSNGLPLPLFTAALAAATTASDNTTLHALAGAAPSPLALPAGHAAQLQRLRLPWRVDVQLCVFAVEDGSPVAVAVWATSILGQSSPTTLSNTFMFDTTPPLANGVVWDTSYSLVALQPSASHFSSPTVASTLQTLLAAVANDYPAVQHISQIDAAWPNGFVDGQSGESYHLLVPSSVLEAVDDPFVTVPCS